MFIISYNDLQAWLHDAGWQQVQFLSVWQQEKKETWNESNILWIVEDDKCKRDFTEKREYTHKGYGLMVKLRVDTKWV